MATYVYETTGKKNRRFEVKQSMNDAPLTRHPDTGEPVRRVITGGYGFAGKGKSGKSGNSAGSASPRAGSCGSGCGCH